MAGETKKFWLVVLLIVFAVGVFYLSTMRPGVSWHSDHVIYLTDAANIVEGRPYGSGGPRYIARPEISKYLFSGPQAYPPIYPLLVAPVYKIFGAALYPLQLETTAFFLLFLATFAALLKDELSLWPAALAVAIVGFNPYIWSFKEDVQSDLVFLFFNYLTLILMCRALERRESSFGDKVTRWVIIGALVYVCYGTRTAGMTLVPAFIAADVLRHRRPTALSIVATCVSVILALAQGALIKSGEGGSAVAIAGGAYVSAATAILAGKTVLYHVVHYPDELARQFFLTSSRASTLIVGIPAFILAAVGFVKRVRRGVTPLETFLVVYALLMLFFPYYGAPRLLLPIAPLFVFYLFLGLKDMRLPIKTRVRSPAIMLVGLMLLALYAKEFAAADYESTLRGPYMKEAQELFAFVRGNTAPEDVIVFVKPREMRYFTGRLSSSYHRPKDMEEQRKYIDGLGVDLIVIDRFHDFNNYYNDYLPGFVAKYGGRATRVFENDEFTAYRWR
jgi:4-amino-4-deoxy-L-arabinose transferase-like glycosyltransferase